MHMPTAVAAHTGTTWREMVQDCVGPGPGGEAFVWDLAMWPPAMQKALPR